MPPKLVNTAQLIRAGVMYPVSGYSRVVSCVASPKTLAGIDYGFTIVVGQQVRLLSVRLWFLPATIDVTKQVGFRVVTGTTRPTTQGEIFAWESVLPLTWRGTGADQWMHFHGRDSYEWTMNRLYTGEGRRFGIWAQCNWEGLDEIYASFQVTEG